jgi:hypothetical protein
MFQNTVVAKDREMKLPVFLLAVYRFTDCIVNSGLVCFHVYTKFLHLVLSYKLNKQLIQFLSYLYSVVASAPEPPSPPPSTFHVCPTCCKGDKYFLDYFISIQCVRHVTGTGTGLLGEIPRVVVQKSALT